MVSIRVQLMHSMCYQPVLLAQQTSQILIHPWIFRLKLMTSMGTSPFTPLEKKHLQTLNVRLLHMKYSRKWQIPLRVPLNLILLILRPEESIRRNSRFFQPIKRSRHHIHSTLKLQQLEERQLFCCLLNFWLSLFNVDLVLYPPSQSQHSTWFSCLTKVIAQWSILLENLRLIEIAYVQSKSIK